MLSGLASVPDRARLADGSPVAAGPTSCTSLSWHATSRFKPSASARVTTYCELAEGHQHINSRCRISSQDYAEGEHEPIL